MSTARTKLLISGMLLTVAGFLTVVTVTSGKPEWWAVAGTIALIAVFRSLLSRVLWSAPEVAEVTD